MSGDLAVMYPPQAVYLQHVAYGGGLVKSALYTMPASEKMGPQRDNLYPPF
jgi:hypothetical protein